MGYYAETHTHTNTNIHTHTHTHTLFPPVQAHMLLPLDSRIVLHGTTTAKERKELTEEGIDLISIPWVDKDN